MMEVDDQEFALRKAILDEQQEYIQLCRICFLTSERNFRNMKQSIYEDVPYFDIYKEVSGRELLRFGKFAPRICAMCEVELLEAYKFKKKLLTADDKARKLLDELAPPSQPKVKDATSDEIVAASSRLQIAKKEATPQFVEGMILDEKTGVPGTSKQTVKKDGKKKRKFRCKVCRVIFAEMEIFKIHKCMCIEPMPIKEMQVRSRRKKTPAAGGAEVKKETSKQDKKEVKLDEISKTMTKFKSKRARDHTCPECGKVCSSRQGFLNHMDEHTENPGLRYDCDQCGEKFRSWESRRTHIYRDHLKKPFCKCMHCGKEFMDTQVLRAHIKENHTEDFPGYQCDKCGKDFRSKKAFQVHNKQHENEFGCRICLKVLKSQNSFLRHMDGHAGRNGEKHYTCPDPECCKKFINDFNLITHLKSKHPDKPELLPLNNDAFLTESWARRAQAAE